MTKKILLIEDDKVLRGLLAKHLDAKDRTIVPCGGWNEADAYLSSNEPNLIVADVKLPDGNSLERLPSLVKQIPTIILTAFGSVRNAVEVMRAGAFEYLVKPVSPDELKIVVQRALDMAELQTDHQFCANRLKAKEGAASFMIGVSDALSAVKETIAAVAPSDITVLIEGESGSGKELVARAVHEQSGRNQRNFVAVDCCTLQERLFESELFGHERGAFTGADKQKRGLIEGAEGGTLFLDEIGEIDATIQAKLLRVLETGIFRRVGGTRNLNANIRVVAATNRDLSTMSQDGGFRQDLYYRLSAFHIDTPPLRERREDVPYLAEHFIRNHNFSRRINKKLGTEAVRQLVAYDWPGNVRELKNVVERAIILSGSKATIQSEHLAFGGRNGKRQAQINLSFDHDPTLDELQRSYLEMLMKKHSGHRARVAAALGVSERNIYRLIQRYDLAS